MMGYPVADAGDRLAGVNTGPSGHIPGFRCATARERPGAEIHRIVLASQKLPFGQVASSPNVVIDGHERLTFAPRAAGQVAFRRWRPREIYRRSGPRNVGG
jgi:hypothetical protein